MKISEVILLTAATALVASFGNFVSGAALKKESADADSQLHAPVKATEDDPEVSQLEGLKNRLREGKAVLEGNKKSSSFQMDSIKDKNSKDRKDAGKAFIKGIDKKSAAQNQLDGIKHITPEDLALYIARTGDEDGVSLIIQEMISQHVMSAAEALDYLDKVRHAMRSLEEQTIQNEVASNYEVKRILPPAPSASLTDPFTSEPDYDLLERSNPISLQDSYEEIMYEFAKMIFIQAAERDGDIGIEHVLKEMTRAILKVAQGGFVSQEEEKRLIDLILTALTDTMAEGTVSFSDDYFLHENPSRTSRYLSTESILPPLLQSSFLSKPDLESSLQKHSFPMASLRDKRNSPRHLSRH